ncbi:MAG: efflux RND transporter periplasmic adaptor subunit [Propionivibrio sp.]
MKPLVKYLLLIVGLGLVAGAGWYVVKRNQDKTPNQLYRLESAKKGDITQTVSANGTLNPIVLVNVGTQVSGTVTQLYVDFNDKVEKGQPLLELDRSLLAAQARQSAAAIGNISATLELARANEARMKALFAQEYVSRQEFDQATQARKSAEAQLAQARALADRDQVNLNYTTIRSPVSGIVVDRVVDRGQTVAASLQTPTLIKIAQDLSEMRIDSSFAEADIGRIKPGQGVQFTVDAFPDRSFSGEVQQIRLNPTVTQNVVTYNVRISLQNPDQILLPGMTAYVNIAIAQADDVLTVPNAALRFKPPEKAAEANGDVAPSNGPPDGADRREGRKGKRGKNDGNSGTVYIVEGKTIRPVAVELGITDNRTTEITGGELKAGDLLIVGERPTGDPSKPSSLGMRLF